MVVQPLPDRFRYRYLMADGGAGGPGQRVGLLRVGPDEAASNEHGLAGLLIASGLADRLPGLRGGPAGDPAGMDDLEISRSARSRLPQPPAPQHRLQFPPLGMIDPAPEYSDAVGGEWLGHGEPS